MLKDILLILMSLFTVQSISSQEATILPALQKRTDVGYTDKTRHLYTTFTDPKIFDTLYPNTSLTYGYIIRHFFCTNIHLNASDNRLVSMDKTHFELSENAEIETLVEEVVSLIGGMYFGGSEYREFMEAIGKDED